MSIWKSSLIVFLLTLLGRISGYGRDFSISLFSGANQETDIAFLILTLPDLIINLILAGGLNSTIIPKLETLNVKDKKIIAGQIILITGIFFIVISILISINAEYLLRLLAPGLKNVSNQNNLLPLQIIGFTLPISAISGVVNSILNSNNIFYLGALGSTILNLSMIIFCIFGFLFFKISIIWSLIFGFIFGVITRFLLLLFFSYKYIKLYKIGDKLLLNFNLLKLFLGNFGFTTALIIMPIISRSFASQIGEGSISLFSYSYKLLNLPLALIMGSFTTVLLPHISKKENLSQTKKIIKKVIYISLSLSIFAFLLTPICVELIFNNTSLNHDQVNILSEITSKGFLFLMPMSLTSIYGIKYAAERNTFPLFICGLIMISNLLFISPYFSKMWSLNGVITAYGLSYVLGAFFMFIWDNKNYKFT